MKVKVDKDACIGCGFCASVCPEVFVLNENEKAEATAEPTPGTEDAVQDAISGCPVGAITEDG